LREQFADLHLVEHVGVSQLVQRNVAVVMAQNQEGGSQRQKTVYLCLRLLTGLLIKHKVSLWVAVHFPKFERLVAAAGANKSLGYF
jgi:hypothetical protein